MAVVTTTLPTFTLFHSLSLLHHSTRAPSSCLSLLLLLVSFASLTFHRGNETQDTPNTITDTYRAFLRSKTYQRAAVSISLSRPRLSNRSQTHVCQPKHPFAVSDPRKQTHQRPAKCEIIYSHYQISSVPVCHLIVRRCPYAPYQLRTLSLRSRSATDAFYAS